MTGVGGGASPPPLDKCLSLSLLLLQSFLIVLTDIKVALLLVGFDTPAETGSSPESAENRLLVVTVPDLARGSTASALISGGGSFGEEGYRPNGSGESGITPPLTSRGGKSRPTVTSYTPCSSSNSRLLFSDSVIEIPPDKGGGGGGLVGGERKARGGPVETPFSVSLGGGGSAFGFASSPCSLSFIIENGIAGHDLPFISSLFRLLEPEISVNLGTYPSPNPSLGGDEVMKLLLLSSL